MDRTNYHCMRWDGFFPSHEIQASFKGIHILHFVWRWKPTSFRRMKRINKRWTKYQNVCLYNIKLLHEQQQQQSRFILNFEFFIAKSNVKNWGNSVYRIFYASGFLDRDRLQFSGFCFGCIMSTRTSCFLGIDVVFLWQKTVSFS